METTIATTAATIAAETIPTIAETVPVIEVVEVIDYTQQIDEIIARLGFIGDASRLLTGFALAAVVVCLCYFCYKFFRIFF